MNALESLGWHWGRDGYVTVTAIVGGRAYAVKVPVADVRIEFGKVLPLGRGVGYVPTGVGLFGFIKKAVKKVGSAAKKAVSKAARGVTRRAGRIVRGASRGLSRAAKFGAGAVRSAYRNPFVQAAFAPAASTALYMRARKNPIGRRIIGATPLRALEPAAQAFEAARKGKLAPKRLLRSWAARNTAIARARKLRSYQPRRRMW